MFSSVYTECVKMIAPFHVLPNIIITVTCELKLNLLTFSRTPTYDPLETQQTCPTIPEHIKLLHNHTQIIINNKTSDR